MKIDSLGEAPRQSGRRWRDRILSHFAATLICAAFAAVWSNVAFAQQPASQSTGQVDWNSVYGEKAKQGKLAPATPLKPIGEGSTGPLGLPDNIDKLRVPDSDYLRWPLPPGEEAYAWVNGAEIKKMEEEVVAISEESRAAGDLLWGRIAGTPYDHMSADWVEAHFKRLGLEVHREEQNLPPEWFPTSCDAELIAGGKTVALKTAMPVANSTATGGKAIEAQAVWVGWACPPISWIATSRAKQCSSIAGRHRAGATTPRSGTAR